jgi:hypothetical protein
MKNKMFGVDTDEKIDVSKQVQYCLDRFVEHKDKIDNDAEILPNLTYGEVSRALVNAGMEIVNLRLKEYNRDQ